MYIEKSYFFCLSHFKVYCAFSEIRKTYDKNFYLFCVGNQTNGESSVVHYSGKKNRTFSKSRKILCNLHSICQRKVAENKIAMAALLPRKEDKKQPLYQGGSEFVHSNK